MVNRQLQSIIMSTLIDCRTQDQQIIGARSLLQLRDMFPEESGNDIADSVRELIRSGRVELCGPSKILVRIKQ